MRQRVRGRAAPVVVAVLATLVGLGLAFLLKNACTSAFEFDRLCYNDIQPLFGERGIEGGAVPYVQPGVEYPVLTGTFMYVAGRVLDAFVGEAGYDSANYLRISALLLAPFALAVTLLLRPRVPASRLMLWALGTPTILYAFHNWDLLAVAGAVAGLVAYETGRFATAGAALGLGASAKLYPLFLFPAAWLGRLGAGARTTVGAARAPTPGGRARAPGLGRLTAGFAGAALAVNVPWMIAAWEGWLYTWNFHAVRYPDFGTIWYWLGEHGAEWFPRSADWWSPGASGYRDLVSAASFVLFAGGTVAFLWRGWRRRPGPDGFPLAATGLGIVAIFLVVSKVHSPQFALWIVPFLVLLDVPWLLVAAYLLGDAWEYVAVFNWFDDGAPASGGWRILLEAAVFFRAFVLAALAVWAWRARRVFPAAPDERRSPPGYAAFERPSGLRALARSLRRR